MATQKFNDVAQTHITTMVEFLILVHLRRHVLLGANTTCALLVHIRQNTGHPKIHDLDLVGFIYENILWF